MSASQDKKKPRLSDIYKKQAKVVAARRRVKAKAKAEKTKSTAGAAEAADVGSILDSTAAPPTDKNTKTGKKTKRSYAAPVEAGSRRRIRADQLPWKTVNTSTLPGMDGGGGMMMLEELDGVGVEWIDDGEGRKTVRFVAQDSEESEVDQADGKAEAGAEEGEETTAEQGSSEKDDAEEDEGDDDDDALPTFAGMDASDLDEADDEPSIEAEPYFDDRKLPAWKSVSVHTALKRGMLALQFKKPTEIQERAVPLALEGKDIVGVAETGSGKTLAYSLPILSWILRQPAPQSGNRRPLAALVLCPTRELAIQVNDHLLKVVAAALKADEDAKKKQNKAPRISIGTVVGGLSAEKQKRILDRGCDILVATPGRLWDLMKMDDRLAADVRALRFLVIDEADRMIETGHFVELESIVGLTQRKLVARTEDDDDPVFAQAATQLTETDAREDMQTFVFSATLSKELQVNLKKRRRNNRPKSSTLEDLVDRLDFRDENPAVIDLSPEGGLVATLREAMVECVPADKDLYLYYFLLRYPGRSLVFTGSIDGIRRLIPLFETLNVPVWPLHSQLQQKQRLRNLDRFKAATSGVLIATDVAARGLDIPHVDHVIHFNLPRTADSYVHRSGRTARAHNPGFALQLVSPEDRGVQRGLLKSLGRSAPPPDLDVDGGFLPKLRERIAVARDIEKAQHNVKKENHDRNWLKEAAEAMDIDIDPGMFSDAEEDDPDAPYARKSGPAASRAKNASKVPQLKAKLASLLAQPLLARGVSARYPTSGTRVVVGDMVAGTAHEHMLGAGVGTAYEMVDLQKAKRKRPRAEDKGEEEPEGVPTKKKGAGQTQGKPPLAGKGGAKGKAGKRRK